MDFLHCLNELEEMFLKQRFYGFNIGPGEPAPDALGEVPGVYGIYEGEKLIYVGESKKMRHRLWSDHRLGRLKGGQFNRYLSKKGLTEIEARKQYLRDSCRFRFLGSDDLKGIRTRKLLEAFLTAVLNPELNAK